MVPFEDYNDDVITTDDDLFDLNFEYNKDNATTAPTTTPTTTTTTTNIVESGFDELDKRLVQTMADLSVQEIQNSLRDVYGVAEPIMETPTLIRDSLLELDRAISTINNGIVDENNTTTTSSSSLSSSSSYERAYQLSPEYVTKCRLMALRVTSFDVKEATNRLIKHFEKKEELFGINKLTNDIQINDLNEDDLKVLESGCFQLLPKRDRAGRAIICAFLMLRPLDSDILNVCRAMWYVFMTALEDEQTQKMGTVVILNNFGPRRRREGYTYMSTLVDTIYSILERRVGSHVCYDNIILRPFIALKVMFTSNEFAARTRFHYGTPDDFKAALSPYGIPIDYLPMDDIDSFPIETHIDWLNYRRRKENEIKEQKIIITTTAGSSSSLEKKTTTTTDNTNTNTNNDNHNNNDNNNDNNNICIIKEPQRFDVLFGRGRGVAKHTGNIRLRHIVQMHGDIYEKASKYRKTDIADRIVEIIHESNGRFLKQINDPDSNNDNCCCYEEVSDASARNKISHLFRKLRITNSKK